jgi:N-acetylneuraminate synthase
MNKAFKINGRLIAPGRSVYIIAELSANHNQNFKQAIKIIRLAKKAGADAIKLQTYTPDTITIDCNNKYFRIGKGTIWQGRTLYDLYKDAYTPWEWQPKLKKVANDLGMDLFSSPFDFTAVDFLEKMNVPAYKIASFELVDIPLIKRAAKTGKPVILSTGMATLAEIKEAIYAAKKAGATQIALLKCTSAYPALPEEMNLCTIPDMVNKFGLPVGLSDHSLGFVAPVAAVALGACIVEKHFTLSRSINGPDSTFSLEPDEFKAMVSAIRTVEKSLGEVNYSAKGNEAASRVFRRSFFVVKDMRAGDTFTEENIRSIRPAQGLHTKYHDKIMGKKAKQNIKKGTPLKWHLIK